MTRLLVVGLDGGTDSVIGLPDANLPNIAEVREQGASGTLISTVPPITAAAWPSMMTGWNPGRHGMFDFRTLGIERYSRLWGAGHSASFEDGRDFVTSRRWSGAAFWDQAEAPVAILSVPMTFPTWEVDGRMVAASRCPTTAATTPSRPSWRSSCRRCSTSPTASASSRIASWPTAAWP